MKTRKQPTIKEVSHSFCLHVNTVGVISDPVFQFQFQLLERPMWEHVPNIRS
jgi:hypothetical protein